MPKFLSVIKWLVVFVAFGTTKLYAQDLLITMEEDSLNCKIIKQSETDFYEIGYLDSNIFKTKLIASKEIKLVEIGFFEILDSSNINVYNLNDKYRLAATLYGFNKLEHMGFVDRQFRISLDYSSEIRFDPRGLQGNALSQDMITELWHNNGLDINASMALNKKRNLYLGLDIAWMQGNVIYFNQIYGVIINNNTVEYKGDAEVQTNVFTYGLDIKKSITTSKKYDYFYVMAGLNYLSYSEDFRIATHNSFATSNTMAMKIGIAYDHMFNKNWSLGGGMSYQYGILSDFVFEEYEIKNRVKDNIQMSSLHLSFGIKYYFNKFTHAKK